MNAVVAQFQLQDLRYSILHQLSIIIMQTAENEFQPFALVRHTTLVCDTLGCDETAERKQRVSVFVHVCYSHNYSH